MSGSAKLAWAFVAFVLILHFDFWLWTDKSLLFGFLPVGLGFQMLISILAAIAWALVVKMAWPGWIEKWAEGGTKDS